MIMLDPTAASTVIYSKLIDSLYKIKNDVKQMNRQIDRRTEGRTHFL